MADIEHGAYYAIEDVIEDGKPCVGIRAEVMVFMDGSGVARLWPTEEHDIEFENEIVHFNYICGLCNSINFNRLVPCADFHSQHYRDKYKEVSYADLVSGGTGNRGVIKLYPVKDYYDH